MALGLPLWSRRRYADIWRTLARQQGELTYVALGDSAAQGIGASAPALGYVGLLASIGTEAEERSIRVVNLSVSGATARDVLELQLPRLAEFDPAIVTCAVGGNDMRRFVPEAFEVTMRAIIRALPAHALIADVPCFYDGRGEQRSRAASAIIRREADAAGRTLVELHRATESRTREQVRRDFALDFFHPNDRGYAVWAGAFEPAFRARLADLRDTPRTMD